MPTNRPGYSDVTTFTTMVGVTMREIDGKLGDEHAKTSLKDALAEMSKATPDDGVYMGALVDAWEHLGEARGYRNAVHDIENG